MLLVTPTKSGTVYNQRVKWSGLNDSSTWTPSQATQSGFQDIVGSHGNIQAIVGGESAGVIYGKSNLQNVLCRCSISISV